MFVILKSDVENREIEKFLTEFKKTYNADGRLVAKNHKKVIVIFENNLKIDVGVLKSFDFVDYIDDSGELIGLVSRFFKSDDTMISIGNKMIGEGNFCVISGPCSVESEQQIYAIAKRIKMAGCGLLRGGAFKPRTSPYSFQGLGRRGIELLLEVKRAMGLCVVSELTDLKYLDLFSDIDVIQVGARNMQNFEMLRQLGRCDKPIILKRGISNTIREWLLSAEYILSGGNNNVILCERGIRTHEPLTRNTLDISAIPMVKKISHLPIIIDPSHATGRRWMVAPLSKAAVVAGADGVMVEVHDSPSSALSDGKQSLSLDEFDDLMENMKSLVKFSKKNI